MKQRNKKELGTLGETQIWSSGSVGGIGMRRWKEVLRPMKWMIGSIMEYFAFHIRLILI